MPGGYRRGRRILLMAAMLALSAATATRLFAIETTYGEDPVPNAHRFNGSICLGYGVDPIPVRSPLERWTLWQAERGRPPSVRTPSRSGDRSPTALNPKSGPPAGTSRPKTNRQSADRQAKQPTGVGR
jgi:hypothetical protein